MDGEVLLAKSETDIAVASITAAGIVPGVVTIGNQQITVDGSAVSASSDSHFGGVVSIEAQAASNAQYHVNQLNEELLRGGEISSNLKSAVQVSTLINRTETFFREYNYFSTLRTRNIAPRIHYRTQYTGWKQEIIPVTM